MTKGKVRCRRELEEKPQVTIGRPRNPITIQTLVFRFVPNTEWEFFAAPPAMRPVFLLSSFILISSTIPAFGFLNSLFGSA
jgi:hypothetical protein